MIEASHSNRFHRPRLPDRHISHYHTGVAQFRHVVCHRRSVWRWHFPLMYLFFLAADANSRSFCEFFSVANVNRSLNRKKVTSFGNCFEQLSLAWQFASISSPAGISLNTSYWVHGEKMIRMTPDCAIWCVEQLMHLWLVLIGLVQAHLLRSYSLQYAHAWSAIAVLLVDAIFEN